MTRAEIKRYIKQKYKVSSIALWVDAPNYIVFRNKKKKWFGIIMDVPYNKVYRGSDKENVIDIMNVKLEPVLVSIIKNTKGFIHEIRVETSKKLEKNVR